MSKSNAQRKADRRQSEIARSAAMYYGLKNGMSDYVKKYKDLVIHPSQTGGYLQKYWCLIQDLRQTVQTLQQEKVDPDLMIAVSRLIMSDAADEFEKLLKRIELQEDDGK